MKGIGLLTLAVASTALLAACTVEPAPPAMNDTRTEESARSPYVAGVLNVKLSEELAASISPDLDGGRLSTRSSDVNGFFRNAGVYSASRIFSDDERYLERQHREGLHLWYRLRYDPGKMNGTRAADRILSIDGVEVAEPELRIRPDAVNDPMAGKQWHLYQSGGTDINVTGAWDNYTTGNGNVIVAVIDGGVDIRHEDLAACTLPGGNGKSHNFCYNSNTIHADDHGSHVAGIIGAVRNNGIGIAGIAGGDASTGKAGVTIMSCQIFDKNEKNEDIGGSAEDAMRYAADNGAVISQNSWGYNFDTNNNGKIDSNEYEYAKSFTLPSATKAAIDYFIKYAGCDNDGNQLPGSPMKGGVVIFSAGNDNIPYGWPAMYEEVIAVGSITSDGSRSEFSNYGDWVDICAPGSDIYSTVSGGYGYMSGTSMACPMVSGAAALVVAHRGGEGFTNAELKDCLIKSAGYDKISTTDIGPLVDALGAVVYGLETAPEPVTQLSAETASNNITVSWTVPDKGDGNAAYGTTVYLSRDRSLLEGLDPRRPAAGVITSRLDTYGMKAGDRASVTIGKLSFETDYYITAASFNAGPAYSEPLTPVRSTTGRNNPPAITPDSPIDDLKVKASERISFSLTAADPDGHEVSLTYHPGSSGESAMVKGNSCTVYIDGAKAAAGTYTSRLVATDAYGLSSEMEIHYSVLENTPPVITGQLPDMLLFVEDGAVETDLTDYFADPDSDVLTYTSVSDNPASASVATGAAVLYITPHKSGTGTVTVTANDPRKASASQTFRLAVRTKDQIIAVYPTQVEDKLNIATGRESLATSVSLISADGGNEVFSCNAASSAFSPIVADLSGIAPGRYFVKVEYGGESVTRAIVKL